MLRTLLPNNMVNTFKLVWTIIKIYIIIRWFLFCLTLLILYLIGKLIYKIHKYYKYRDDW